MSALQRQVTTRRCHFSYIFGCFLAIVISIMPSFCLSYENKYTLQPMSFHNTKNFPKISQEESYEALGNYITAWQLAKNDYKKAAILGLVQKAAHILKTILTLEKKIATYGFSHRLFDGHCQPRAKLIQLLQLVGMPSIKDSNTAIIEINEWAQNNLLLKGERWQKQTTIEEHIRPHIASFIQDLGFVEGALPHFTQYQGALVHGALLSRVRLRLHFLVEQWKQGIRFSHLYFLTGARPLEPLYENTITLTCDDDTPLKIRQGWHAPEELPKTEYDMVRFLWEQADIPEDMRKSVVVNFINAPMKEDSVGQTLRRPTTDDTVKYWLKENPPKGCYLSVTNAPYLYRQDLVVRAISLQEEYSFDTVGYGTDRQEKLGVCLDEVARYIFQVKKTFKVE